MNVKKSGRKFLSIINIRTKNQICMLLDTQSIDPIYQNKNMSSLSDGVPVSILEHLFLDSLPAKLNFLRMLVWMSNKDLTGRLHKQSRHVFVVMQAVWQMGWLQQQFNCTVTKVWRKKNSTITDSINQADLNYRSGFCNRVTLEIFSRLCKILSFWHNISAGLHIHVPIQSLQHQGRTCLHEGPI